MSKSSFKPSHLAESADASARHSRDFRTVWGGTPLRHTMEASLREAGITRLAPRRAAGGKFVRTLTGSQIAESVKRESREALRSEILKRK